MGEFVLVKLYVLLRDPAVLKNQLGPADAASLVETFRSHLAWRLIDYPGETATVMDGVPRPRWDSAGVDRTPAARSRRMRQNAGKNAVWTVSPDVVLITRLTWARELVNEPV